VEYALIQADEERRGAIYVEYALIQADQGRRGAIPLFLASNSTNSNE
jgi:hypothetical protein